MFRYAVSFLIAFDCTPQGFYELQEACELRQIVYE